MGYLPEIALSARCTPGMTHAENLTQESADKCSRLLQENHYDYHIFTHEEEDKGVHLHNHLVHHDTTLYALGATPEQLEAHHRRNTLYQRLPPKREESRVVSEMADYARYKSFLGDESHYLDFVHFFEKEIRDLGYQAVLQKYLVSEDEVGMDMLPRIYMGYVHSLMHVGIALEFNQMAILAEGLAQAAVHHDYWYTDWMNKVDRDAKRTEESALPLSDCLDLCRADDIIRNSSSIDFQRQFEGDKFVMRKEMVRDGVCANAGKEIGCVAARYRVDPNDLDRATAELINSAVYSSIGAQKPPHECRYDFFLIHGTNASIWHSAFLAEPSLSARQKARLLEYTGRCIMLLYASMGCPEPRLDWVLTHRPRLPRNDWASVFQRVCLHEDDGHMSKLVRAIAHARKVSEPYDSRPEFRVKQHMFLPAAVAAVDGGSKKPMEGTIHFDLVRGAAWPEAWSQVPVRA